MIQDNPRHFVVISLVITGMLLPVWDLVYAADMPANTQDSANVATAAATTPPLPRINALEPVPGVMEVIPLSPIFFEHNKSVLDSRSRTVLDDAAHYILNAGHVNRVIIQGHTNSIASQSYNYRLSDKRALAVRDYLAKKQVPADKLRVMGWGEEDPIDENWTRAGQQRNRHVEIILIRTLPGQ